MKKRLVAVIMTIVMTMTVICTPNFIAEASNNDGVIKNDDTGIPDSVLYNDILNVADSNGDGILTVSEAEQITRLTLNPDASKNDVKILKGIRYCKGLQTLSIFYQEIEDISELAYLTNLEYLSLNENNISDITALSNLQKLKTLLLDHNNIKNISALSTLSNLEMLELGHNQIDDLSALKNLSKLEILRASYNELEDITAISSLTSLEELTLWGMKIKDISPLSELKRLYALELGDNEIRDITVLASLTELIWIELPYNKITDISPLSQLPNLEHLNVEGNPIGEEVPDDPETPSESETPSTQETPSESETPSTQETPIDPETPDTPEKPSNPNIPAPEDAPVIEGFTETQAILDVREKSVINKVYFESLVNANKEVEIIFRADDGVYFTFNKGTMSLVEGVENYDFAVEIESDYDSSKVPATIKESTFVSKVNYKYSGKLPGVATIQIPVGEEYAEKTLYYMLLNEDGSLGTAQKVVADKEGCIKVQQDHCSSYIITTEEPNVTQDSNVVESPNTTEEQNSTEGASDTPNTGDASSAIYWIILLLLGGVASIWGLKKKKLI